MRFFIEFIYRLFITATYRDEQYNPDPDAVRGGRDALLNRTEPLA